MKSILTIVVAAAVLVVGALFYAWSGTYNIAATEPHWGITVTLIDMLKDRSIEVRSGDIPAPNLNDSKLKEAAFPHYNEMCRFCHGAPGYRPEEFARGLYPAPPTMTSGQVQESLNAAQIYWVVKHGIKMTGMPAFGPTHDEQQLWGLVALAEEMPQITPEQYRKWVKAKNLKEGTGHTHTHGEATHKHH